MRKHPACSPVMGGPFFQLRKHSSKQGLQTGLRSTAWIVIFATFVIRFSTSPAWDRLAGQPRPALPTWVGSVAGGAGTTARVTGSRGPGRCGYRGPTAHSKTGQPAPGCHRQPKTRAVCCSLGPTGHVSQGRHRPGYGCPAQPAPHLRAHPTTHPHPSPLAWQHTQPRQHNRTSRYPKDRASRAAAGETNPRGLQPRRGTTTPLSNICPCREPPPPRNPARHAHPTARGCPRNHLQQQTAGTRSRLREQPVRESVAASPAIGVPLSFAPSSVRVPSGRS